MNGDAPTTTSVWATCGAMDLTGDPGGPPLAVAWKAGPAVETAASFGLDASVLTERAGLPLPSTRRTALLRRTHTPAAGT